jgi:hypothetical protein
MMGEAASTWRYERTLAGHGSGVYCLATWGGKTGKVASGLGDKSIRVWDVGAETLDQTLVGHVGIVLQPLWPASSGSSG